MPVQVKICGLTGPDAVDASIRAGAIFGGLVFHSASPRNLPLDAAALLAARMRGRLKIAALVADLDDPALEAITQAARPDFLQLHGGESVARTAAIRARFGPVIKALPVAEAADLASVPDYEAVADMLLFDARAPRGALRGGGHGVAFDWNILRGRNFLRPWFLAGGLNPENIARAVELSGAVLVDVSSGVESAPAIKDAARIAAFVAAAQAKKVQA